MELVGFLFEREQKPYHQNQKEKELKFIHPELISKWQKDGYTVRAKKFYIKPLSDESHCEIGFVTGKTSALHNSGTFSASNSFDSFDSSRAWVNRENDKALEKLLKSIKDYLGDCS